MNSNYIILFLCFLVMLSYIYNIVSKLTKIPSVILLLGTGVGLKYLAIYYNYTPAAIDNYVQILGTVGLIMIVLEASLDLHLTRSRVKLIRNSFLSAVVVLAISVLGISALLYYWLQEPFINSVVYAIPLSIISSSMIIPSVGHMNEPRKEFLVYEASFSDIIGILLFNFFATDDNLTWNSLLQFGGGILGGIVISLLLSFVLIYMLSRISTTVKFFLIFSILITLYVTGKMVHLPSLIIIMVFGLMINNWHIFRRQKFIEKLFSKTNGVAQMNEQISAITAESAFLLRTFFFIAFGYSIDLNAMLNPEVALAGTVIVLILLFARFVFLRLFMHSSLFPEVLMIPRGLITILLFYIIPDKFQLHSFDRGILSFVVLVTALLMMVGLLFHRPTKEEEDTNLIIPGEEQV